MHLIFTAFDKDVNMLIREEEKIGICTEIFNLTLETFCLLLTLYRLVPFSVIPMSCKCQVGLSECLKEGFLR